MRRTIAVVLLAAALLGACGDDDSTATTGSGSATGTGAEDEGTFPVTIATATGKVTIEKRPTRIISLSPTATEMLFAIGAGEQVAAVDDQSTFPAEAPRTKLSGVQPNIEAIAAERPELVVISNDIGSVAEGLGKLDIPVLLLPSATKLDDTSTQIEQLGAATGRVGDAAELATSLRSELEEITKRVGDKGKGLRYYHELDNTLYTVTSKTFAGEVYARLGLVNIADAADSSGSGYPQLSAEYIVKADPDLIFLADTKCCKESAETVAKRPGFGDLRAVKSGNVVELDDDIASRWGPRVVDFFRAVAEGVEKASAAKAGSKAGG